MSAPLTLFSGLAVKGVLEETVLPAFTEETGIAVQPTYEPTKVLERLVAEGARPDVFLGVAEAVRQLAAEGVLGERSQRPLVRSGIGLGVAPDAPAPPIASVDQLVATLRAARSVAYSRTGASGAHFAGLLDRLGIADEVGRRATVLDSGFTGEALLDGRADLAVQQIIELKTVAGVHVIGPLPADVQHHVELWVAAAAGASSHALQLVAFLTGPVAVQAYAEAGLDPVVTERT